MVNTRKGFKLTPTDKDKRIADLEAQIEQIEKVSDYNADQLTKAKEILKKIVDYYPCYNKTITEQAEQFLKEIEND